MINIREKKNCCGCHACYNICPQNAIEMIEDEKGFKYPKVNEEKCINCGLCEKACPIINEQKKDNKPIAYACYCKEDNIRKESSSGGIFTLIAKKILKNNGIVYGAAIDEEFNVKHIAVEKIEDLELLRGSKYVQSDINNIYRDIKNNIKEGKEVLFTGTPCQVEGLKSYLGKEYDNLYTQDIICHGVPSPKVWNKYKEHQKNVYNSNIKKINFRNKDKGWKNYNLKIEYSNGKNYERVFKNDLYMKAFLQDLSIRDACFSCKFKKINRVSDITLADFWGIKNVLPEMDDDKGTSLVILNSSKGEKLFRSISEEIIYKEVDLNEAIKYNPSMIKSAKENPKREKFFEDLNKEDNFEVIAKKYVVNESILIKVKRKIGKLFMR